MDRTAFTPHGDLFAEYVKNESKHDMPIQHYHDSYEIYLLTGGRRYVFFDSTCSVMHKGDVLVCKPFDIHYAKSLDSDYYERFVINFRTYALDCILNAGEINLLEEKLQRGIIHLSDDDAKSFCTCFELLRAHMSADGFLAEKMRAAALLQIVMLIAENTPQNAEQKDFKDIPDYIIKAIGYMRDNCQSELNLDEIADFSGVSKYHFARTFHKVTGGSVMTYLNNMRLAKAYSLLIYTDMTIAEISTETGFGSYLNLSRAFKRVYGQSLREFRKKYALVKK